MMLKKTGKKDKKMNKPILIVLAAGMGSRYGGLKQIDPVDSEGHTLLDFSVYDAKRAGFGKVIFIIKHSIEKDFKNLVGNRIAEFIDVEYVFQENDRLPKGYQVPRGRVKPFGTGHAVLCAAPLVDAPFAVINADDYYGLRAFQELYSYLTTHKDDDKYRFVMIGFHIENTVTKNGHVARGICKVDHKHHLTDIIERTRIEMRGKSAAFTLDDGASWKKIPDRTPVSMNCWGFTQGFMKEIVARFPAFLDRELKTNPLKCEYFLPGVVSQLLKEDKAVVTVLESDEKWYGVTYKEDKKTVTEAIKAMKKKGLYPLKLWA